MVQHSELDVPFFETLQRSLPKHIRPCHRRRKRILVAEPDLEQHQQIF